MAATAPQQGDRFAELRARTTKLAVDIHYLCRSLRRGSDLAHAISQVRRSSSSGAANHRAVCRARTRREFIAKLGTVLEECDETMFWLELMEQLGTGNPGRIADLRRETNELTAIFVASRKTALRKDQA